MIEATAQTSSEKATRDLAGWLTPLLVPGDVLALVGELGAGKTRFVQGLARGLGVPAEVPVTSPTFTFLAVYDQGRLPLYHFDFYRIGDIRELERIGADDFLWGQGVSVVEWADRARTAIPEHALWVEFTFDGDRRVLTFRTSAEKWRHAFDVLVGGKPWP